MKYSKGDSENRQCASNTKNNDEKLKNQIEEWQTVMRICPIAPAQLDEAYREALAKNEKMKADYEVFYQSQIENQSTIHFADKALKYGSYAVVAGIAVAVFLGFCFIWAKMLLVGVLIAIGGLVAMLFGAVYSASWFETHASDALKQAKAETEQAKQNAEVMQAYIDARDGLRNAGMDSAGK
ncbi:MAG: hypothetical protein RR415_02805 [Ruthenibacterium sp.]